MLATGVHIYNRRQCPFDLYGVDRDGFVIKLKDEAQVEECPGTETVANTENDSTIDDERSVSSAVDDCPSLSSRSHDAIEQETVDHRISPLKVGLYKICIHFYSQEGCPREVTERN